MDRIHKKAHYKTDFPHLATILASSYTSQPTKELLKSLLGASPGFVFGMTSKDNFLQQNSLVGDKLTRIDKKDENADKDFFIFHYHPAYKNLRLDEAITNYYHKENLTLERDRLYKEALAIKAGVDPDKVIAPATEKLQSASAAASLGGLMLLVIGLLQKISDEAKKGRKKGEPLPKRIYAKQDWVLNKSKQQASSQASVNPLALGKLTLNLSWSKNPLDILGVGILNPIGRAIGSAINTAGKVVLDYVVKPIANITVVPLVKHVVAPVFNNVVKPAIKAVGKAVVKLAVPVLKKVAKPVVAVAKAVVDAGKYIYNSFIKPKGKNGRIKPNRKKLLEKGKRRRQVARKKAGNPFVDEVIKPFVKPIYRRVIKPVVNAAKHAYNKYVKPAINYVHNNVIKPIGNFLKGLWG